jgi:diguanylate cyclase (GGDEF)-like protein
MNESKCTLLVVDDDPHILSTLPALLADEFEVLTAASGAAAQRLFTTGSIDIVLADQNMPRMTGVSLLEWVKEHHPQTMRLLMTGFAELEEAVEAINRSQVFRYIFKPWRLDVLLESLRMAARTFLLERSNQQLLNELRQLNLELEKRVSQRTRELAEVNLKLEELARTDPLTGLLNRRGMDELVARELDRRARYQAPVSLGLVDIDHFKEINTRYLHPGGDKVLVSVARALNRSLRTVDHVGRVGGDEFQVIAPETSREGAAVLGDRIHATVEQTLVIYKDPVTCRDQTIPVRVSVGFAVAEEGKPADYDKLKHVAAVALSEAKITARRRCVLSASCMGKQSAV